MPEAEPAILPADRDRFVVATLPPGPVADRLAEAQRHVPDRPARVLALATEAFALAGDDPLGRAFALGYEGFARYLLSEHDAALDLLTRSLAQMEPLGDLGGRALVLNILASVHVSLGHYDEALDLAQEALRIARALGDIRNQAWVLAMTGNTYLELGRPEPALTNGEAALRLFADLDDGGGQARAHTVLGGALVTLGRTAEARAHLEAALRIAREADATLTEARALGDLGRLALADGDPDASLALHRQALTLRVRIGNRQAQATSLIAIGRTLTALGRADEAIPEIERALALAKEAGAGPREAEAHEALADTLEAASKPAAALAHLRERTRLREDLLSAQARSRIQAIEARAEAERARQDAEIARLQTEELGAANRELSAALDELRAAQRRLVQTEKQASLGRLSAGLAHEIQNPLNFVANFSELNAELATDLLASLAAGQAGGAVDSDAVRDDLEAIVANSERVRDHARRADGIVRGLMGHVRDVGGERRPADLHELIEQAVSTVLGPSIVHVERAYALLDPVEVEPASLQRVFVNVFENARWAAERRAETPADGFVPTVQISTEAIEGAVEVRVVDNGVGIALAHCTRVFEPFFTTKPAGAGIGLGLSLAYDIVTEGHGGTLAAYSREGQGATFVLTLPA